MADMSSLARSAREGTGLTQREFAQLIGANAITISKWETGARRPSKVAQTLLAIVNHGPEECVTTIRQFRASARGRRQLVKKAKAEAGVRTGPKTKAKAKKKVGKKRR
jgi:transcriptional regulator with XRE-family HTH domain